MGLRQNPWPDHDLLMLLIGSNPLPNAVSGRLLISSNRTDVHLLHSNATATIAGRIREYLMKQAQPKCVILHQVDPDDGDSISREVSNIIRRTDRRACLGINYTGGTKMMAVQAVLAARGNGETRSVVLSYLNARDFRLQWQSKETGERSEFVGDRVVISLNELAGLHKRRVEVSSAPTSHYSLACAIGKVCVADVAAWKRYVDESKTSLRLQDVPEALEPFVSEMRKHFGWSRSEIGLEEVARELKIEKLKKFLDGQWLEYLVYQSLLNIKDELNLAEVAHSVKLTASDVPFEVDVVAIRGYQLFAVSCGTSAGQAGHKPKRAGLKLKLFEAYVRAHQFGGDEARVALVTLQEPADAMSLQQEMESELDERRTRIRVFGRSDLPGLSSRLKDWIISASGGR